jgi:hypothetical protein
MEIVKISKGYYEVKAHKYNRSFTIERLQGLTTGGKWAISQGGILGRKRFATAKAAMEYLQGELDRVMGK